MKLFRETTKQGRLARYRVFWRFEVPNLDDPEQTYLTRYGIVQTPWFSVFVHRMDGPDSRSTLHDHPWQFVSFVLKGGYHERRLEPHKRGVYTRRVTRVNVMRTHDAHSIERLIRVPTWTLMVTGPRRRVWGYWRREWVDYGTHVRWTWTQYDKDEHNAEFDHAIGVRAANRRARYLDNLSEYRRGVPPVRDPSPPTSGGVW